MAWSSTDVTTLEKAIATGARKVRFADGREVEYRSLAEMTATLDMIKETIGGGDRPRVTLAKFTRA